MPFRLPKNISRWSKVMTENGHESHGYLVDIESGVVSEGCVVRSRIEWLLLREQHPSSMLLLSCQPRVTVTSCLAYKVIRDL